MDKIVLSIKDADFIANFVRNQVSDLNDAYKEAMTEGNKRADEVVEFAQTLLGDDPEIQSKLEELEQTRQDSIKKLEETFQTKLDVYEKILLLMMTGSTEMHPSGEQ